MGDGRRLLRRLYEKAGASQTLSGPIDSEPPRTSKRSRDYSCIPPSREMPRVQCRSPRAVVVQKQERTRRCRRDIAQPAVKSASLGFRSFRPPSPSSPPQVGHRWWNTIASPSATHPWFNSILCLIASAAARPVSMASGTRPRPRKASPAK